MGANGRPAKYKPIYCKRARQYLAKGYSKRATAGLLEINEDTFYEWIKVHPEFKEAVQLGSQHGEAMYISKALGMIDGNKGSFQALQYIMSNVFKWRSEPKEEQEDSKVIQVTFAVDKPEDSDKNS